MFSLNNISEKINKYLPENFKISQNVFTNRNVLIAGLIIYTAIVSMYTPRALISLFNVPLIKILMLGLILYVSSFDIVLAIFIVIAFIVTLSIDNSITVSKANLKPIINRDAEGFVGDNEEDNIDEFEDVNEEQNKNNQKSPETEYEEENPEEDDDSMMVDPKSINDTFKNLHDAIHKLENFISTKQ